MKNYYTPSGKFSPISFLYLILASVTIFPILGLIYAYCIWYCPFIYINFFITIGYAFGISMTCTYFIIGKGKIRNQYLALFIAAIAAFIALYLHWAVWLDLVLNISDSVGNDRLGFSISNIQLIQTFELALQPNILFSLLNEVNITGTWGIRGATISGWFLWIIWAIEFFGVLGFVILNSYGEAKKPFCEKTNVWFDSLKLPIFNFITDTKKMVSELERNDFLAFENLVKSENAEENHSEFTLYSSKNSEHFLSIENKVAKTNSKGKIEFDSEEFVEYVSINNQMSKLLLEKK